MHDAITDVEGVEVGHATDFKGLTGCTVVLAGDGAVVGADVRGSAPGTRETDLCKEGTLVEMAQAILLAGGSAFGLDAAAGVMRYLHERKRGFDTGIMRVPIVPGAVIFDLGVGEAVWPSHELGYRACASATGGDFARGSIGAGTGASVGKATGMEWATKSGVGSACEECLTVRVGAIMVVNAFGDVVRDDVILAGARTRDRTYLNTERWLLEHPPSAHIGQNTTIGVVATDARLNSSQVNYLARIAHNGLARTIRPVHTMLDGDTIFVLATGARRSAEPVPLLALGVAAVKAVERAVWNAVLTATPGGGLPVSSISAE